MLITQQDINKLAELAKLDLNVYPDDLANTTFKNQLIADLNNILNLVEQLKNIDTSNVTPLIHPDEHAKQRLRPDLVTEENVINNMQAIAPLNGVEAGLYLVPKVIETE
jgi:aspartyl-tRNA(Asn)/glutamyl-tRNA(Gln) amidotransferase subunit C